jgi:hypothetical protein
MPWILARRNREAARRASTGEALTYEASGLTGLRGASLRRLAAPEQAPPLPRYMHPGTGWGPGDFEVPAVSMDTAMQALGSWKARLEKPVGALLRAAPAQLERLHDVPAVSGVSAERTTPTLAPAAAASSAVAQQEDAPGAPPSDAALARVGSFRARMASPEHRAWLKRAASSHGEEVEAANETRVFYGAAQQQPAPAPAPARPFRTPWMVQQQRDEFQPPAPGMALEREPEVPS